VRLKVNCSHHLVHAGPLKGIAAIVQWQMVALAASVLVRLCTMFILEDGIPFASTSW